jgi:tRNA (cytidine/uridine-2'-O-)-methyltransferase
VLVEPLIPQNAGSIARLCAATGAWLHFVEPLGFDLDHKRMHRAGLDYWPGVRLTVHPGFDALAARLDRPSTFLFTKRADRRYTEVAYPAESVLVFGKETTGLSEAIREAYRDRLVRIPTTEDVRSINVANAVAVASFEVIRQHRAL